MIIETDRLQIVALTIDQLTLWTDDIKTLEKELNCTYAGEPMEGFFLGIVKRITEVIKSDEDNYIFSTFWFMIRKSDRVVVGSTSFKGIPNDKNEVGIGYGLGKVYEGNGYMTETVKAMCKWAKEHEDISYVIAETEAGNVKSENVLKRCGFVFYKKDTNTWWRV